MAGIVDFVNYVREIGEWLWAVANGWAGYATGGLIVALIALWTTLRNVPISRSIGIGLAILFLIFAMFNAWRVQRERVKELEARFSAPSLGGEITLLSTAPTGSRQQDTFITVAGHLTNQFGPPTAVIDFSMELQFADGHVIKGFSPVLGPGDFHLGLADNPQREVILKAPHYWPAVANVPIPAGGVADGWYLAVFRNITNDEIHALNPTVVLTFIDVIARHTHYLKMSVNSGSASNLFDLGEMKTR